VKTQRSKNTQFSRNTPFSSHPQLSTTPQLSTNPQLPTNTERPGNPQVTAGNAGKLTVPRAGLSTCSREGAVAFSRCRAQPRRTLAAALLCCVAQAGLLGVPLAMAQESEPEAAVQVQAAPININTATAEELAAGLSGVGASKAMAIVRYREQFGDFESIEELAEVRGIGMATIEKNRALLRLR
jgi:competence protein ComEA